MTSPSTPIVLDFPPAGDTSLEVWEELSGELIRVNETDGKLGLELSAGSVAFEADHPAVAKLRDHIDGCEGNMISVLRTDLDQVLVKIGGGHHAQ